MLKEEMLKRKEELENMIADCKKKMKQHYPEGLLRVTKQRNTVQYFQRRTKQETNGTYLRRSEFDVAQGLAQKEYYQNVLELAERELKVLSNSLQELVPNKIELLYSNMNPEKRKLIKPYEVDDETYLQEWLNRPYEGLAFSEEAPFFLTRKKERVRSKSEVIIADHLYELNIPYKYECPYYCEGYGMIYPDFTILNVKQRKEVYLEHFGMMDDPVYLSKFLKKQSTLLHGGIIPGKNLFMTFESKSMPLSTADIDLLLLEMVK